MDGDIDENIDKLEDNSNLSNENESYAYLKLVFVNLYGLNLILQCKKKMFKVGALVWFTFLMRREKKVRHLLEKFSEDFVLKRIVKYNI